MLEELNNTFAIKSVTQLFFHVEDVMTTVLMTLTIAIGVVVLPSCSSIV